MAGRRRTRKETGTLPSGEIAQLNVTIRRCLRPQPEFKDVSALVTTLVRALNVGFVRIAGIPLYVGTL